MRSKNTDIREKEEKEKCAATAASRVAASTAQYCSIQSFQHAIYTALELSTACTPVYSDESGKNWFSESILSFVTVAGFECFVILE